MAKALERAFDRFSRLVDWFIPADIAADRDMRKQARLFLVSHLCGPFIGNSVPGALFLFDPHPGYQTAVLAASVTAFWVFPFLLKYLGRYNLLAVLSIQNLMFCIIWGNLFCGGIASPTLPWFLTIPLLSFFYLGSSPEIRWLVLVMFLTNLVAFYGLTVSVRVEPSHISPNALQVLGVISTIAAAMYVAMMALFYAKALASQAELELEMRNHAEQEAILQRAAAAAERAGRAKSEFLSRIGRDMRKPLTAVIAYSALLRDGGEDTRSRLGAELGSIRDAGLSVLRLLNDVADLSKIEAGQMEIFGDCFRPADLLRDTVAEMVQAAAANGNSLTLTIDQDLGAVCADMRKIRVILIHLLGNAIKFTQNGAIHVAAEKQLGRPTGDMLVLTVEDAGVGMDAATVESLMAHGLAQESARRPGVGLGLQLTNELCLLLGGELSIRSWPGEGSRVTARIPVEPLEAQATSATVNPVRLGDGWRQASGARAALVA